MTDTAIKPDRNSWSSAKRRSVLALVIAQVAALSVWFSSAAILPDLAGEADLSSARQAAFSSAVQFGFVIGAFFSAMVGIADRFDPRRLFAASAILAAGANTGLLVVAIDGLAPVFLRGLVGFTLAGVYPVGLKLAAGWGTTDRGLLVGLLVGALTIGSASPHLIAAVVDADWRWTIALTSAATLISAGVIGLADLGPYHQVSGRFRFGIALRAWTDRRLRLVNLGYLGHMWELYAMWAWIGPALAVRFIQQSESVTGLATGRLFTFAIIGIGAVGCLVGGWLADRIGRIEVTVLAMILSATSALAVSALFDGNLWLLIAVAMVWGFSVIADSAQFSALIADYSPGNTVGTMLTMQTCLGFLLTILTVQIAPAFAAAYGWPVALAALAIGPALGIVAMLRLKSI